MTAVEMYERLLEFMGQPRPTEATQPIIMSAASHGPGLASIFTPSDPSITGGDWVGPNKVLLGLYNDNPLFLVSVPSQSMLEHKRAVGVIANGKMAWVPLEKDRNRIGVPPGLFTWRRLTRIAGHIAIFDKCPGKNDITSIPALEASSLWGPLSLVADKELVGTALRILSREIDESPTYDKHSFFSMGTASLPPSTAKEAEDWCRFVVRYERSPADVMEATLNKPFDISIPRFGLKIPMNAIARFDNIGAVRCVARSDRRRPNCIEFGNADVGSGDLLYTPCKVDPVRLPDGNYMDRTGFKQSFVNGIGASIEKFKTYDRATFLGDILARYEDMSGYVLNAKQMTVLNHVVFEPNLRNLSGDKDRDITLDISGGLARIGSSTYIPLNTSPERLATIMATHGTLSRDLALEYNSKASHPEMKTAKVAPRTSRDR